MIVGHVTRTRITDRLGGLAPDYALGWHKRGQCGPGEIVHGLECGEGVPILAMADGPVGVLRALSVRCGVIDVTEPTTVAAARLREGVPVLTWWVVEPKGGAA